MRFVATELPGAYVIELERQDDARGGFARIYCAREFEDHGLDPHVAQTSLSWSPARGTLRGLHYQLEPHAEAKTVRVVAGAVFDVAVDLRAGSPTFRKWIGVELSADNGRALYVPAGCAHGFLTIADATVVLYQISVPYAPDAARGVRWNDPALAIAWPFAPTVIGARDREWPELSR
jgi:dTDP-4-dehydrorhamnose 3,5-epimerase